MPDIKYFSNIQSKSTGDVYVVKDEGAREQIDDIYKYNGEVGAKNLIPYPYHDTTKTANGVTFTDNGDGTVTVSTESGGATADVTFDFRYTVEFTINNSPLKIGESYVLSCEGINSTASGYRLRMYIKDSNLTTLLSKAVYTSEGVEFVLPSNTFGMNIQIFIPSGTVLTTPFTFKPMLRLASDTDNTYQPYAKTNRQLTEDIAVPKYDPVDECIYYEGGDQFTGAIDSAPTAGSANAVSSGGTKTYVDNALSSIGAFRPCGTVTFANLPAVSTVLTGDMYNISDAFTTTSDFKEGSGHSISAGANVYKTADGMWDILAGVTVTGVKGDKEQNYRQGNINLTPANVGAVPTPSTSGTSGQVLATDGSGGTSWVNVQSPITFDNVPTQNSNNAVKSGGVFSSLGVPKIDTTTGVMYLEGGAAFSGNIDSTPTAGSNNAVASGGTKTYVDSAIDAILDDSTNYCEIGNTLIQWGQINIATTTGSVSTKSVSFPKPYANPNYLTVSINPMTSDDVRARASSYTTTGFTACVTDIVSATRYLAWVAVGKKA